MKHNKLYIALIFLWIGFISAISFMEAWLKFKAEGVTLPIGLSIGSLVFNALNKVEILISLVLISITLKNRIYNFIKPIQYLLIPILILALQTLYLLPSLNIRAHLIIQNQEVQNNYTHVVYVVLEILKLVTLLTVGIKIIRHEYK